MLVSQCWLLLFSQVDDDKTAIEAAIAAESAARQADTTASEAKLAAEREARLQEKERFEAALELMRSQASEAPLSLSIKRRSLALALAHLTLQALPQQDRRLQPVCVCVCALICWRF